MAHIVSFAIDGLAGSKTILKRQLDRHLNVFFGLNGTGKTSLLRILHSALDNDATGLENVPFQAAEVVIYSDLNQATYTYSLTKRRPAGGRRLGGIQIPLVKEFEEYIVGWEGEIPVVLRWDVQPMIPADVKRWRHRFLPTTRLSFGAEVDPPTRRAAAAGDEAAAIGFIDAAYARGLEREWLRYFGQLQARIREAQQHGLADILMEVLQLGPKHEPHHEVDLSDAYPRILAFLRRQHQRVSPTSLGALKSRLADEPILRRVLTRIDQVEREIEQMSAPRTQLQAMLDKMFMRKHVRFEANGVSVAAENSDPIPVHMLSSGEKHLLRVLLQALDAEDCSLLIDEPELSMHLDWQRELVPAMRKINPLAQLIFATHSPEVMSNIEDKYIFEL
jgi:putative AbiEii toxin of type IV toxin-antitoxin system/AAA domain-containing protein